MNRVEEVKAKYAVLRHVLDEASARAWAATEARAVGRGGIAAVALATGMSRDRIRTGLREIADVSEAPPRGERRIRKKGGGRKRLVENDPTLVSDLLLLVEPGTRGDPQSPLRWTLKSLSELKGVQFEPRQAALARSTAGKGAGARCWSRMRSPVETARSRACSWTRSTKGCQSPLASMQRS